MSLVASNSENSGHLIMPEEAAHIMSHRAGYEITTDDLRQLRRRGKVKAAKQLSRTTLYELSEIEKVPLPKKRAKTPKPNTTNLDKKSEEITQVTETNKELLTFQIDTQIVELEKQKLALEEKRLALVKKRLDLIQGKRPNAKPLNSRTAKAQNNQVEYAEMV